jgi:Pvc16 N-terminal domain
VTAALQDVLQPAVSQAVGLAKVGFSRPDASNQQTPLVNIYLYQVTPNAAYRNADLPTRRPDGSLVQKPQVALDLHYLFTFHGNDDQLEPQRLLGAVSTALNAQPLLSTQNIVNATSHFSFLSKSNLADQIERVKFTPTSLSLEEFSKLWSVFFQIEYSLSAAFQASVVLMESDDTPREALPVLGRNLYVSTFRSPSIDRVISQAGPDAPITAGSTLLIQGQQLRGGDATLVLMEGVERVPTAITDTMITLPLPANVHAGVQGLQVIQKKNMGTPPAAHRGFESNVAPFVLRPTIGVTSAVASVSGGTDVVLNLTPNIGIGQRAVLLLDNLPGDPVRSFMSQPVVSAADSSQIIINIHGVPAGKYLVRVQIDGAESLLTTTANVFSGPTVTMP